MHNNSRLSEVVLNPQPKRKRLDKMEDLEGVLKSGESIRSSLERRLKSHISISGRGCWEWTGCLTPNGYPQISFKRRAHYAHRLSYAVFVGPIETNKFVLHQCDNPKCINPAHLRVGDVNDNAHDALRRDRVPLGVQNYRAKLTEAGVFDARLEYSRGLVSTEHLASIYGVSRGTMGKAIRGEKWKHVPFPA